MNLESTDAKEEYAAQKRLANLKSMIDKKGRSELLLAQMQAAFPTREKKSTMRMMKQMVKMTKIQI